MLSKLALLVAVIILFPLPVFAASSDIPTHLDRKKLPYGCGSCHVGFDFRNGGGIGGCMVCHGNPSRRTRGLVASGIELRDIEADFKKNYRHPTFEARNIHSNKETLPETDPRAPRHADCMDCHNLHYSSQSNRFAGIKGKRIGSILTDITHEYELCYKCHAESANLPGRYANKRAEFSLNNLSFHPIEGEGKNTAVISLLKPYKEKKITQNDISTITCGDCHGSDSSSSSGPHGSIYQYILVDNFSTKDNEPESSFAYALCYRCHNRNSILGDESFKFHSLHVKGKGGVSGGTSCHTCHSSHGSTEYKYLIRFNRDVVVPNSRGVLKFTEKGVSSFRGECYLSCHGVNHDPKSY